MENGEENIRFFSWKQAVILFLQDNTSVAWKIIDETLENSKVPDLYSMLPQAVRHSAKHFGRAKAFEMAQELLCGLLNRKDLLDVAGNLQMFFAALLNTESELKLVVEMEIDLLDDIAKEARLIFKEEPNVLFVAMEHIVQYLRSGKDEAYLEDVPPDIAITIKSILKEKEESLKLK